MRAHLETLFQIHLGHLNLLLYILSINDVNFILNNLNFLIFADAIKIFRKMDCNLLQMDHNLFEVQCKTLFLNSTRCQSIIFIKKRSGVKFSYFINNTALCSVGLIKEFGVTYNFAFSFNPHIEVICIKSSSLLVLVTKFLFYTYLSS